MTTRLRRVRTAVCTAALLAPAFVAALFAPAPVAADASQDNGCLGVTGTFSTFAIPITGAAAPETIAADATTTLSGTGITVQVTSALVVAGVNTGLVQAAATLADVGTPGGLNGTTQGENAVVVAPGGANAGVHLTLEGSNTGEGTQTATNAASTSFTFYAVNDGTTVTLYQGTPNPPTNSNLVDVTATGIPVSVALADTTWTGVGGPVAIRQANKQPSSLTAPTAADKASAPLRIYSKINGLVTVNFFCWPGTASADGKSLVPLGAGPTNPIDTVAVTGTSATTSTSTSTTTTSTTAKPTTTTTAAPTTTTTASLQPTPVSGTQAYGAECSNSVNDSKSIITFTVAGTTMTNVKGTDPLVLKGQSWKVDVPGSVLDTGINLGLVKAGDTIKGALKAGVAGIGTAEGQRVSDPVELTLGPVVVDGVTGLADPVSATVALPDWTWTPAASTVAFSLARSVVDVKIPLPTGTALTVTFTCTPPADAKPFVTATILGETPAVAADSAATSDGANVLASTATRSGTLPRTGPGDHLALQIAVGVALLDIGYLAWSAARTRRRRRLAS